MGLPGLTGVDHIGFTVPDLEEATRFLVDVLGCEYLYSLGPFVHEDSDWMAEHLNVDPRAVMRRNSFFRLGGQAIFEVFSYEAPDQNPVPPRNSDIGGHHVAFYVTNIDRAVAYIKRCQDGRTGGFRYTVGGNTTTACTGTSILGLELCGKDRHHSEEALRGGGYLLRTLPHWGTPHFFYSIYYCSQATFQLGDNYWSFFRPHLHEALLGNQESNGAWLGLDPDSRTYGPNYGTAMAVLALTVEYRYLPIYQRGEEPAERDR